MKRALLTLSLMSIAAAAQAHSASDAYLSLVLEADPSSKTVLIHGQWDIALRDLDFVLKLDENGDGRVTWGEVRRRQTAIEKYAYAYLRFASGGAGSCTLKPTRQLIDDHADGAYAALFFDVACEHSQNQVTLDYRLFFAIDPSHRAILVLNSAPNVSTALLSPENARLRLEP